MASVVFICHCCAITLNNEQKAGIEERLVNNSMWHSEHDTIHKLMFGKACSLPAGDTDFVMLDNNGEEITMCEVEHLDKFMNAITSKALTTVYKQDERW